MITKTTEKLLKQLGKAQLPTEDRVALTTMLLSKLVVLPIKDAIEVSHEGIKVRGRDLDAESTIAFRESCMVLKDNMARNVLRDQLRFLAVQLGVHNGLNTDTIMFSKAVLWCMQEEDKLLSSITDPT